MAGANSCMFVHVCVCDRVIILLRVRFRIETYAIVHTRRQTDRQTHTHTSIHTHINFITYTHTTLVGPHKSY